MQFHVVALFLLVAFQEHESAERGSQQVTSHCEGSRNRSIGSGRQEVVDLVGSCGLGHAQNNFGLF